MAAEAGSLEWLKRWDGRIRYWSGMFAGTSYFHQPQGLGLRFSGSKLGGYFNDLTGKAQWTGPCDPEGLPLLTLSNGSRILFPIMLCQKALGHWDLWMIRSREEDRKSFLGVARWLRDRCDGRLIVIGVVI